MYAEPRENIMYAEPRKDTILNGGYRATDYPQQECGIGVPIGKETAVDQIVQLREHVNTLHEMFTVLEQKLSPVRYLTPQCAEKEKKEKVTSPGGSELRHALADQNDRLMALRIRLNILMDEIDL